MKTDLLQKYISMQSSLQREREELLTRLRQIEDALGAVPSIPSKAGASGRRGRGGNPMPLRDAVIQVTARRAMTKEEIVEAVQRLGYRFTGKDPLNVVGVVVYGKNPAFRNEGGRFSPIGRTAPAPSTGKRMMSPAARERIAAAQRARWARQQATDNGVRKPTRRMSPEGRARIAAAARARWAKARATRG
jgi:hypothetical protein